MGKDYFTNEDSGRVPERELVLLAWHGIGARVPESWNIVGFSGNVTQGYLRADGPDEESIELRWKKTRKQPDLDLVAEDFLKQVRKVSRKQKSQYEGDLEKKPRGPREKPDDVRFEWRSDRRAIGRLIWCRDCRRTLIAQVSAPLGYHLEPVADKVLESIRDHGEKGFEDWGVYGMQFSVPETVKLSRHRLMSGFFSMNFRGRSRRVIIERWGLADTLLDEGGMLSWHENEYLDELRGFRGEVSAVELGDHEALETTGYEAGFRRIVALVKALFIPGRAERYASLVWHCHQTNRIIGIRAYGIRPAELVRAVAGTVRCHNR